MLKDYNHFLVFKAFDKKKEHSVGVNVIFNSFLHLLPCSMIILHSKSRNQLQCRIRKGRPVVCANKLSLNIEKTSFVVFHSPRRRIAHKLNLSISNTSVKSDNKLNI